jgi:hypothetical protein
LRFLGSNPSKIHGTSAHKNTDSFEEMNMKLFKKFRLASAKVKITPEAVKSFFSPFLSLN